MTGPVRPNQEIVPGSEHHRLLRGVLRMDLSMPYVQRVVLTRTERWAISLVDSGDGAALTLLGDTALHILWQRDEDDAWIEVDGTRFPIAPGDTVSTRASTRVRLAGGMLLAVIEANTRSLEDFIPPSHGVETFEGYNRRTEYRTPAAFTLQRWKITRPLTLSEADEPFAIVDLAAPLAITWPGGTDLIGRGECRIVPPGTGPATLLPDGLGYALIVK